MFNIEFMCRVGGKPVSLEALIETLLTHSVTRELARQAPVVAQTTVQKVNPPSSIEPLVVGIPEAARLLGLRPSTIRAMLFRNRIPSVRMGRRVLIAMEAIRKIARDGIPQKDNTDR